MATARSHIGTEEEFQERGEVETPQCTRVVIIEPYLKDYDGHFYQYLTTVQDEMERRNIETVMLGCRAADECCLRIKSFYPVFSCLSVSGDSAVSRLKSIIQGAKRFHEDLVHVFTSPSWGGLKGGDVLFMETVFDFQLVGWGIFLRRFARELMRKGVKFVFLVRHRYVRESWLYTLLSAFIVTTVFRCLLRPLGNQVVLATDSRQLKDEYERLLRLRVEEFPIPLPAVTRTTRSDITTDGREYAITYLGGIVFYKGFDVFVDMMANVLSSGHRELTFKVQAERVDPRDGRWSGTLARAVCKWMKLLEEYPNIEILPSKLSPSAYYDVLARSHVVVVPYRGKHFVSCTSGVFAEVLATGRVPIVSRGTWMAKQLAALQLKGFVYEQENATDLTRVVLECVSNYPEHLTQICSARRAWQRMHNERYFVGRFIEAAGMNGA